MKQKTKTNKTENKITTTTKWEMGGKKKENPIFVTRTRFVFLKQLADSMPFQRFRHLGQRKYLSELHWSVHI